MPTMKIEMTIPELQSFIATNRKIIADLEYAVSYYKSDLKYLYQCTINYTYKAKQCTDFIKEDKRELKQHRRDLAHYVKLQIAAKKALRKAYEDQREAVMIDLVNEVLRLNRERAEHQNEFVANIIVC